MRKEPDKLVEAKKHIGLGASLTLDNGLIVSVTITDAKFSYGHIIYTVTPVAGSGSALVRENIEIDGVCGFFMRNGEHAFENGMDGQSYCRICNTVKK